MFVADKNAAPSNPTISVVHNAILLVFFFYILQHLTGICLSNCMLSIFLYLNPFAFNNLHSVEYSISSFPYKGVYTYSLSTHTNVLQGNFSKFSTITSLFFLSETPILSVFLLVEFSILVSCEAFKMTFKSRNPIIVLFLLNYCIHLLQFASVDKCSLCVVVSCTHFISTTNIHIHRNTFS